MTVVRYRSNS